LFVDIPGKNEYSFKTLLKKFVLNSKQNIYEYYSIMIFFEMDFNSFFTFMWQKSSM